MKKFPKAVYIQKQLPGLTKVVGSDFYCGSVADEDELKKALSDGFVVSISDPAPAKKAKKKVAKKAKKS